MAKPPPLGDQELEALRYCAENGPLTVGEMAKSYGTPRGLARTTVLTMMDRLRRKGYVSRAQVDGVYQYSARHSQGDVMTGLVAEFVSGSLGGSLTPFVAYLANTGKLSDSEIQNLKRMVESLETEEKAS